MVKSVVGGDRTGLGLVDLRVGVDLVEEASPVVFVKYACKAPRLLLERLHILDLHHKDVSRFGAFHLKGTRQIVNLGEVNVLHIVRAVIVANLPPCPIHALHFEDFPIFNFGRKGNYRRDQWQLGRIGKGFRAVWMPSVLKKVSARSIDAWTFQQT